MRILAVDDDPIILELLSQFLSSVGPYTLSTAESAHAAIALLTEQEAPAFDAFLLDIQMPEMDGIALAQHIRKLPEYAIAPIVMLTAMSEKRYIDSAFSAGATDYVTKPFDLTELKTRIGVIAQLVESRKAPPTAATTHAVPDNAAPAGHLNLHEPMSLHDIDSVIDSVAMENYVAQLSRSSLFGSTVFAFSMRKPESYYEALSAAEFRFLIEDVAEVISDALSGHQFLMTYAGSGTYLCITESGWRPDMPRLTDQVNLQLSRAEIVSNDGTELHPRMSSGAAIRLVWKSGDQILNALSKAQASAEHASAEYERLKTDFFHVGKTA